MTLAPPKNPNYCATVVQLSKFVDLPNCDNVKAALIFGNSVIVGKDTQPGAVGLFFPVETQILRDFLVNNNLYRKPEWGNIDPEKKGFFEEHGRVKCMKFRGNKSEGFWIPIESLAYLDIPLSAFTVGMEFDCIGDRPICKKYIPRHKSRVGNGPSGFSQSLKLRDELIVEGQFRFHPDTSNLRKSLRNVVPDMWISISEKWHGTSAVIGNLLVKRELKWYEKLAKKLGVQVQEQEYGLTWSSRKVIKGVNSHAKEFSGGFYQEDVWGLVAHEIRSCIPNGVTLYGEIVGYTPSGAPIQKGYHYGCQPGTHRFLVYRVTYTNPDGKVLEFSWNQMKEFCEKYGLQMVKELWCGRAEDLVTQLFGICCEDLQEWQSLFLKGLETYYVNDSMCIHNNLEVPAEGIVIKVDRLDDAEAYKLKNFLFLEWETKQLDKGEVDMETQESEEPAGVEAAA